MRYPTVLMTLVKFPTSRKLIAEKYAIFIYLLSTESAITSSPMVICLLRLSESGLRMFLLKYFYLKVVQQPKIIFNSFYQIRPSLLKVERWKLKFTSERTLTSTHARMYIQVPNHDKLVTKKYEKLEMRFL